MFGFKLIKEKELLELQQPKECMVNGRNLSEYFVLKTQDYVCSKCSIKSPNCFKLQFSNQTICVTAKENVNSFVKPKPKKRTKKQ